MKTWIALFRGINVGGNNILPMARLRSDLETLTFQNVRTYIQSGNVVFDSVSGTVRGLATKITREIEEQHGFRPNLLLLTREELLSAVESNPFPQAVAEPKSLHFFFLDQPPDDPDLDAIDAACSPNEEYRLTDHVFYLHAPDGIGRSKLAANVETHLGVVTTARNYRTVDKLLAMVGQT